MPSELNLTQYSGVWAIEETTFNQMYSHVMSMNLAAHMAANSGRKIDAISSEKLDTNMAKIAVVDINGTMTKKGSSLSDAGSTSRLTREVSNLARNQDVDAILLRIDSPGGSVSGISDLGAAVAKARESKPVYAFVEDLGASAAYWIASQTDMIFANNNTAKIGSIGTYIAIPDVSKAAEKEGVEMVVIRSSPLKGAGIPGEAISEEAKAYWQEQVDAIQAEFESAVKSGRKMTSEQLAAVSTGRVYMAEQALSLKLIDGIQSFDATLEQLAAATVQRSSVRRNKDVKMSTELKAASYVEIIEACEGVDPTTVAEDALFVCRQLNSEATAESAVKGWMGELKTRATTANETAEAAVKAKAAEVVKPKGAAPLEDAKCTSEDIDPVSEWKAAIDEEVKAGKSRQQAIAAVEKKTPGLRQAMLDAVNKR